jgi:hypothetical protein
MDTNQYLKLRIGPLQKVEEAMSSEENRTTTIDKLNLINNSPETPLTIHGVYTSTYPATFTIRQDSHQGDVEVWVRETRVGYDTPIPYLILNEGKVMKTVIRDMFVNHLSPHFAYPAGQLITNDGPPTDAHICMYTITEYLPGETYLSFDQYINNYNISNRESSFGLITGVFQLFYNLAVMEGVRLRHNDLQLRNVYVNPHQLFRATYIIEDRAYQVPSTVFLVFRGYERSVINTDRYTSLPIPESEEAWQTWDPYADLATVWSAILSKMAKKTDMLDILFGNDPSILEDLRRLTQPGDDRESLERCLPTRMARRFADQFFTPVDPRGVSGIVFSTR